MMRHRAQGEAFHVYAEYTGIGYNEYRGNAATLFDVVGGGRLVAAGRLLYSPGDTEQPTERSV